jgi:hypothetical protein
MTVIVQQSPAATVVVSAPISATVEVNTGTPGLPGPTLPDMLIVESAADLTSYLSGDEYVLPAGLVVLGGAIDLDDKALRLSTGTVLRGFAEASVTSSIDGVVRCSALTSNVIMREFSIIATGGRCVNLSGPIDYQLNVFFVGLIGVGVGTSAGTVSGFDVQSFKDCFINAPDGLTFDGTTNKTFVSRSPFYSITGSAIRFAETYAATVADISTTFFKFNTPGVGVEAVAGYTLADGLLRASLIDGTAIPLSGLTPADVNWTMTSNTGVRDSRIAAQAYLTTPVTMDVVNQNEYLPVAGTFSLSTIAERFTLNESNELVYTGRTPTLVDLSSSFTIDPANNNRLAFRAAKNGVGLVETVNIVEQGAGPGSSPRVGAVVGLIEIATGDRIGLQAANLTNSADIDWLTATYAVKG